MGGAIPVCHWLLSAFCCVSCPLRLCRFLLLRPRPSVSNWSTRVCVCVATHWSRCVRVWSMLFCSWTFPFTNETRTLIYFKWLVFKRNSFVFIPFGSSLKALTNIFWVECHQMIRLTANWQKWRRLPDDVATPASFKADGFVAQLNTQKQNCRAFKKLSIDTQHISIQTIVWDF